MLSLCPARALDASETQRGALGEPWAGRRCRGVHRSVRPLKSFQNQRRRAPFGHTTHLRVFIDPDLLQYDEVWAAAGTWHDVFGIEPHKLVEASEGLVTDLKRS